MSLNAMQQYQITPEWEERQRQGQGQGQWLLWNKQKPPTLKLGIQADLDPLIEWFRFEKVVFHTIALYGLTALLHNEDHLVPFRIVERQRFLAEENAQTAQFSEDPALQTRRLYTPMSQKATRTGVAATDNNTQTASSWKSPTTLFNGRQTASSWMRSTQRGIKERGNVHVPNAQLAKVSICYDYSTAVHAEKGDTGDGRTT